MHKRNARRRRGLKVVLIALSAAIVICVSGFALYANDYYHADSAAQEAMAGAGKYASDEVSVELLDGKIAFVPESPRAGLVFYPGGKVEAAAYAPLMRELAERGILCVICPMPFNLAVFDINAADGVERMFPQVTNWYIGGHSLGGSMAASYLDSHSDDYEGLVLLAAYSTVDLTDTHESVISIRGSEDQVLNASKYEESARNIGSARELVIDGGNHGQFGSYGQQTGDGQASITPEEQWAQTADAVASWVK